MPRSSDSAVDEQTSASVADREPVLDVRPPKDAPSEEPTNDTSEPNPAEDAPQVPEPADEEPPEFQVSLNPDADLEEPVFVTVAGFYSPVDPVEGVETDNGIERDPDAPQSEALLDLDEHGRLELTSKPVKVPPEIAENLSGLAYAKVEVVQ